MQRMCLHPKIQPMKAHLLLDCPPKDVITLPCGRGAVLSHPPAAGRWLTAQQQSGSNPRV